MKSIKELFITDFGEEEAGRIEKAAIGHGNGINDTNKGNDPFKWALLICLGYECMEKEKYRKHHGIITPWPELKAWIKKNAHLETHNGDCDYLALFAGTYNEYMPEPEKVDK
jgi:hypothetical protein